LLRFLATFTTAAEQARLYKSHVALVERSLLRFLATFTTAAEQARLYKSHVALVERSLLRFLATFTTAAEQAQLSMRNNFRVTTRNVCVIEDWIKSRALRWCPACRVLR
jgi:hypothetical protein